jgi:hypothetical protein
VAALQQKAPPRVDEPAYEEDEPTLVSERPSFDDVSSSADGETPIFILVAVGLALSVVVMAIGGGLVFYVINSLTGG